MQTFWEWLSYLNSPPLIETFYGLDPGEYNRLFDDELEKLARRVSDPAHRQAIGRMRGVNWIGYIAASVRAAGFHDQREIQERTHDIAVKLLTGSLFRGFDERTSGPIDLRFKASVTNAVRNLGAKERNRRRLIPTVPIQHDFEPGGVMPDDLPSRWSPIQGDEQIIEDFRRLVRQRLGDMAVAILDVRLAEHETKSLIGTSAIGYADKNVVKRLVQGIKKLAYEYAVSLDDPAFLRRIERALADEAATVQRRVQSTAARRRAVPQVAGAVSVAQIESVAVGRNQDFPDAYGGASTIADQATLRSDVAQRFSSMERASSPLLYWVSVRCGHREAVRTKSAFRRENPCLHKTAHENSCENSAKPQVALQ